MRELPVIFSGPMVQALLNTKPGTWPAEPIDPSKPYKWMTRRVAKPYCNISPCNRYNPMALDGALKQDKYKCAQEYGNIDRCFSKKGFSAGDILWVRETFTKAPNGEYIYRADSVFDGCGKGDFSWTWTSPIFMPREASRITLELKGVRVERVQDITEDDAKAEGVDITGYDLGVYAKAEDYYTWAFQCLWNDINGKKYPWESNPYVFVYEFMRV